MAANQTQEIHKQNNKEVEDCYMKVCVRVCERELG